MPFGEEWLTVDWKVHTKKSREGEVPVRKGDKASARVYVIGYDLAKDDLYPIIKQEVSAWL